MSVVGRIVTLIGLAGAVACTEPKREAPFIGNWILKDTLRADGTWVKSGGKLALNADYTFELTVPAAPTNYNGSWSVSGSYDDEIEMDTEGAWFGLLRTAGFGNPLLILNYQGCCRGPSVYRFQR